MKKILKIFLIAIISQVYTLHSHAGSDGTLEINSKTKEKSAEVKDCFETFNRGIFAFNSDSKTCFDTVEHSSTADLHATVEFYLVINKSYGMTHTV